MCGGVDKIGDLKEHENRKISDMAVEMLETLAKRSLFAAAQAGKAELVAEHIAKGADVNEQDPLGSPLDRANTEDVKAALRKHGGRHSLFHAAGEGMLEVAAELIEAGADVVAQQNELGETALYVALQRGHAEVALLLVEKTTAEGLLLRDKKGDTCLHVAARQTRFSNWTKTASAECNFVAISAMYEYQTWSITLLVYYPHEVVTLFFAASASASARLSAWQCVCLGVLVCLYACASVLS